MRPSILVPSSCLPVCPLICPALLWVRFYHLFRIDELHVTNKMSSPQQQLGEEQEKEEQEEKQLTALHTFLTLPLCSPPPPPPPVLAFVLLLFCVLGTTKCFCRKLIKAEAAAKR